MLLLDFARISLLGMYISEKMQSCKVLFRGFSACKPQAKPNMIYPAWLVMCKCVSVYELVT